MAQQVRLWASLRGQTLYRTVHGMLQYEAALRLQAQLELPHLGERELTRLVRSKFDFVLACQRFGEHKQLGDPKVSSPESCCRG